MISYFRYARHTEFLILLCQGWAIDDAALDPCCPEHHGHWSLLLIWRGEGEP